MAELTPVGVWLSNHQGEVVWMNRRAAEVTGGPPEGVSGMGWVQALHEEDRPRILELWRRAVKSGEPYEAEHRWQGFDHTVRWVSARARPIRGESGEFLGHIGTITDITRLRLAERALIETRELETIGRVAGGVAHHFNNLLTVVRGNAQLLQQSLPTGGESAELLAEVVSASTRAAALVSRLLEFAQTGPFTTGPVDVHALLEEVVTLVQTTFRQPIRFERRLDAEDPQVPGDARQLGQALMQLLMNACDAMPAGGEITLRTETITLGPSGDRPCDLPEGTYLRLTISDTGEGLDEEVARHAFEPFYTTRAGLQRVGLGLTSVRRWVRNHGGRVELVSRDSEGASAIISLPRSPRATESGSNSEGA
jgi:PAS domain S-box-containing protein